MHHKYTFRAIVSSPDYSYAVECDFRQIFVAEPCAGANNDGDHNITTDDMKKEHFLETGR